MGTVADVAMKHLMCAAAAALLLSAGCARHAGTASATAAPEAAQAAPAGDIPDTQVFVPYTSPLGYTVLFPEGWSRSESASTVTFSWHFDGEQITVRKPSDPATAVRATFRGARDVKIARTSINATPATVARFISLSKPDPVTGRSVALDNVAYFFSKGSRQVILTLWAPRGSDNVDQWRKISGSFRWK